MRNFISTFIVFFCIIFTSFSQTKNIEKGTYLSTNKGQKIKLNLLDDDKYELVFYSGGYIVKGDSLVFSQSKKADESFNLTFKNDKKAKKIKVKFLDPSYYPFYIGTQNGSEEVQYQRISDIKTKVDPDWKNIDIDFEIEKADYLYLVYEGFETDSKIYKYALPKDVSEITIKYEFDVLGDLKISGFYDKKTNELKISGPGGKDPIVFLSEKNTPAVVETPTVIAIEKQSISKWTYPGKEPLVTEDFGAEVTVDSAITIVDSYSSPKIDFKFKVENTLDAALKTTKLTEDKFLIVYSDPDNKLAQSDFDTFIKSQEETIGYNFIDGYDPKYDVFNYYLATAKDKSWLKKNKITVSPSIAILDQNGNVLAIAKKLNLTEAQYRFTYYDVTYNKLKKLSVLDQLSKLLANKKTTDAEVLKALNKLAVVNSTTDYTEEYDESGDEGFKFIKPKVDKKQVQAAWKKIIAAHEKDTKPDMILVETILSEIKNTGFTKLAFNEDKVLNDTDFASIDYLIKHYDAIEAKRAEYNSKDDSRIAIGNISTEISNALQRNNEDTVDNLNEKRIIQTYKKLILIGKGNFESYRNYFAYLNSKSEDKIDDIDYLKEFSTYFDTFLSPEKGNVIEKLDEIYAGLDVSSQYNYDGWSSFKEYHSNLCNTTAWSVVQKPGNSNFIKSAITWSEYSLVVTKNNSYYLDTLAQLYYKDGQKEKAIETQKLAVKFLSAEVDEQTAFEIRETLEKMQNGTY